MGETRRHEWLRVGPVAALEEKGVVVVPGPDRPIAVFWHDGQAFAVDNRCPHLGFPLHKGSVRDGLLTCHWHEARFDLGTGCTFDLWADDVPAFETRVEDGTVYVAPHPRERADRGHHAQRLIEGLEQDVGLVQAKSILGLRQTGAEWIEIIRALAEFGGRHHDRWGEGMTLLAIAGNLLPHLAPETAYHLVFRASRQLAADCSDAPARRERRPLTGGEHAPSRLARWMRAWVRARHRDASERVLLTAIERLGASTELADLVFTAASDRVYAQIGHVSDGWNKAFELLDFIGWEQAPAILPLVVPPTAAARGAEEDAHWHHPHEVIEPLRAAEADLPAILAARPRAPCADPTEVDAALLGEDPLAIIAQIVGRLRSGVSPVAIAQRVAYAAAVRLARFSDNNEVGDWFNPRHTFIFANAVHQAVVRSPTPGVVRGVLHGALAVYMDRFLCLPPARLPADAQRLEALPADAAGLRRLLLAALDRQSNTEEAALIVLRHARLGLPLDDLLDALALATVREDLDFHALQVLEAGMRQCAAWGPGPESEQILIGVARQLAAVCPTPRAGHRTAQTALRLARGDCMYEE